MKQLLISASVILILSVPAQAKHGCIYGDVLLIAKEGGATGCIASRVALQFQAFMDELEQKGAKIRYMRGRGHGTVRGSKHPGGLAIDVCQDGRNRVERARRCYLPNNSVMNSLARKYGLLHGGEWQGSPDRGHVEFMHSIKLADLVEEPFPPPPKPKEHRDDVAVKEAQVREDNPFALHRDLALPIRVKSEIELSKKDQSALVTQPAPRHLTGLIHIAGKQFEYGSGGYGYSIPYGDYPVTPNEMGHWGRRHGAIGLNHNEIYDHRLKRTREGIELHRDYGSRKSAGCVVVTSWDQFRHEVFNMIDRFGQVFLHVAPDGARITPEPEPLVIAYDPERVYVAERRYRIVHRYRHHKVRYARHYHRHVYRRTAALR